MSRRLDAKTLNTVFSSRPDILEDIQKAVAETPTRAPLFNHIASFVNDKVGKLEKQLEKAQIQIQKNEEPSPKRRRVDGATDENTTTSSTVKNESKPIIATDDVGSQPVLLEIKDISLSVPQRKKFDLCFTTKCIYARLPGTNTAAPGIVYPWRQIEHAFYLPVPEKSQVQFNYILFPRGSALAALSANSGKNAPPAPADVLEPLVFTVAAGAPKPGSVGGRLEAEAARVSDTYSTLFGWAIEKCLEAASKNVRIAKADPAMFHSKQRQAVRPKEKAVHVKAFRGSKDGYLFFLETGILWGFKKPLMFIPLSSIAAVSYTNVLQRTFNVAVEVFTGDQNEGGEDATEEVEFAMLDQEDYDVINENYVMRHSLQDRSMVDQRKAKVLNLEKGGGKKKDSEEGDANGDGTTANDGLTELQRTEKMLEDEEDEDEEDYDPGSEGDSGGSGSNSDDTDDDDDDDDGVDEEAKDEGNDEMDEDED